VSLTPDGDGWLAGYRCCLCQRTYEQSWPDTWGNPYGGEDSSVPAHALRSTLMPVRHPVGPIKHTKEDR